MKKRVSVILGLACMLSMNMNTISANEHSINRIHFINTKGNSGSDAILLESNGHFALIDTGEDFDFPDGTNPLYPIRTGNTTQNYKVLEDRVFRHLKNVGVEKLDFVLGTHVHSDHIGGVDEVLNKYSVDKLYLKRYSDSRLTDNTRLWDNLFNYDNALKAAKNKNVQIVQDISEKDSHFKLGEMDIQLYNYKNEYESNGELKRVYDDNSNSIVAVITVNGKKIYLGGDLDNAEGAEDLLGPQIGKVDLMKWNHHSESTQSNTISFLENLKPSVVVQTTGRDINVPSTQKWLEDRGTKIVKAMSSQYDATVYDINETGFNDVSHDFPQIPTVEKKWYIKDGYRMYQLTSGEKAIGWHSIDGENYFFDGKGHMQSSKWQLSDGYWYYLHQDGKMAKSGWFQLDGDWYYLNASGSRENDKRSKINGRTYLFDEEGRMQIGWAKVNNKWHFFDESGAEKTGWIKDAGHWYYINPENSEMVTGTYIVNHVTYYFNGKGEMQVGWKWHDGAYHYYTASGALKSGWLQENGKWYYLTPVTGVMATGTHEINERSYYFNDAGEMQTGWKWHDGGYRYYQSSGALKTGWLQENSKWYYLEAPEGIMGTGLKEVNSKFYYFNSSGEMQTGWRWFDGYYHYFKGSGDMIQDGITPDGYKVDGEGRWLPNGVTTTTTTTTTTTDTTTAEETAQEQTTQETTVESTTVEPTTEHKTIPINDDKTSEISDVNNIG